VVRYIKATDLTAEQRQCLEEAIRNDADAERRWSAEALGPDHAVLFRKDGKRLSISCRSGPRPFDSPSEAETE